MQSLSHTDNYNDATVSASDVTVDWIERQYETVDGMDMDGFLPFIDDEAQLRFGNSEPASGHDQIRRAVDEFWDSIEDLRHEFTGIWERDDVVVLEASIRYTKLDGEAMYIPVTTIIEREGEIVTALRIYGDMAPLYDMDPDETPLICYSLSNR